jgi:hypothetical protein
LMSNTLWSQSDRLRDDRCHVTGSAQLEWR